MTNNRTARSLRSVIAVSIITTGAVLLGSTSIAQAQEAAHSAATEPESQVASDEPANLNDDTNRFVYRRYTNDTRTNDRLNAVFHLIQSQGNGLTWDGESKPADDPKAAPAVVAASKTGDGAKVGKADTTKTATDSASPPAPAPAPDPVLTWAFRPDATAQQTLSSWAKIAGWNEPTWTAKNPFQGRGEIHGTFIDALRALASAAPQLNFNASLDKKSITVTDASGS
ncbi:hypothetical protein BLA23254_06880 [Burkholderia lata]|uniref:Toxin co-regulated pilus biosynthesis protein Q C-terminal domain-containing protein n=1 Tax=Burkholderia lata (strain ATCC 17760 / DSM 23089 / LMG 22485 / NCIMB 9086 / R18194 / 383) TaxID=482957 RepID=A0A6P2S233_BURL3|nr:hypothetical protein [Burkholderia lata]VWC39832.1 hypothetical protein BLA23254_06880 [Burkholderia lata]